MLSHTFQHIPRIGPRTESRLWRSGFTDWRTCLARIDEVPFGLARKRGLAEFLRRSLEALATEDAGFFARWLPGRQMWRLYGAFRRRAVFLDIETTGLGGPGDVITVVGLYDGRRPQVFVRGVNLAGLAEALRPYSLVVTYNGAQFDLPFIRRALPRVALPAAHLDLRFPLARLGYTGGLKAIEQRLGVTRDPWVAGLDGYDAVILWRRHQAGDPDALRRLVAYNLTDVINLQPLAAFVYNEMVVHCTQQGGLSEFEPLLSYQSHDRLPGGTLHDGLVAEALRQVGLA